MKWVVKTAIHHRGYKMRKTLRASQYLYQDVSDLMTRMYQLKGAEMVNNEEIAEEIQKAIDKIDNARNNIFEAKQILQQIYDETYDD
jgi:hypothetical protein